MATKQFYATGDFRYGTRMMRAGDPVEMTAPQARLYRALGKIAAAKPRQAKPAPVPTTEEVLTAEVVETPPRKRTARKARRSK